MLFLAMAPAGSKVLAAATKVQNDVGRLAHSGPVRGNFSAAWLKPQADSGAFWTSRAVDRGRLAPLCGQALETHQPPNVKVVFQAGRERYRRFLSRGFARLQNQLKVMPAARSRVDSWSTTPWREPFQEHASI